MILVNPCLTEWPCGDLDLRSNFQKCPSKSFPWTKVATWYIWMKLWLQILIFVHIWSGANLERWLLDLIFSEMLSTAPISLFHWQILLLDTSEWSCGSKAEILLIFVHVVISTFDLWNPYSNQFIVLSLIIHVLSSNLNDFPSSILKLLRLQYMYRWIDGWRDGQTKNIRPLAPWSGQRHENLHLCSPMENSIVVHIVAFASHPDMAS